MWAFKPTVNNCNTTRNFKKKFEKNVFGGVEYLHKNFQSLMQKLLRAHISVNLLEEDEALEADLGDLKKS